MATEAKFNHLEPLVSVHDIEQLDLGENFYIVRESDHSPVAEMFNFDHFPCLEDEQCEDFEMMVVKIARLFALSPEMFAALEATEAAEEHWANCEDCDDKGADCPELGCEEAFNLADKARLMRRAVIEKAKGQES